MEAACWTNSLTNASTFPPTAPRTAAKLTSTSRAESEEEEEHKEEEEVAGWEGGGCWGKGAGGKKTTSGARWQAANPFALPSDSVYLHLAPWGVVSEDSAMMNRPV